jgi:excisionase family DNA binding protein
MLKKVDVKRVPTGFLTTQDAAARLGVSTRRVIKLIEDGRLPATHFGKSYMINEADLRLVAERPTGRPPKPKDEKAKVSRKGSKK